MSISRTIKIKHTLIKGVDSIMEKSIEKKFLDFKKRHNLSNQIIIKMITEYATSNLEFARTYFSDKYGISIHTFYKARDYAVIFGLVDNEICRRLREKTAANYKQNNTKNTARASLLHFYDLTKEREKIIDGFSENEIRDIGLKYFCGISVEKIAICYDVGEYVIRSLLSKGIIELIFDREIVDGIYARVGPRLNGILQKRENNKQALLECMKLEIQYLTQRLKCNEAYLKFSKDDLSEEDVKRKLSDVTEMYEKALQL